MTREWLDPIEVRVSEEYRRAVGGHPLVAETLLRRGIDSQHAARAFLDPQHYQPAAARELPQLAVAAERVDRAVRNGERMVVWGDFDVDGQTSTTLLVSTLRDLGAAVRYHIPHRQRESHGIRLPALQRIMAEGLDLLLTCDTGVTEHDAIDYAREHGVDVVVTDHHDLPSSLPEATAVVNPKMLAQDHPLRELPGVGVAYKLSEALYSQAERGNEAEQHLDLVALGIVADVAVQTGDVRYLLQRGLETLRRTRRLGLRVMMEVAEINPDWLSEEHIGFGLAPRLNSLGRLADAQVAVEFLTTDDLTRARTVAVELEGLNAQRRMLVNQVLRGALAQIEREPSLLDDAALVLSHPGWPGGVIGIVAGRLAERLNRPVILISVPPEGAARGSGRSVQGCNISEALAQQRELLIRFGGHPMAAGLSIDPERIPAFRKSFSESVRETCGEVQEPPLQIDAYMALVELDMALVEQLERLAPFGPGNPALVLAARGLSVLSDRSVGRGDEHRLVTVADEDGTTRQVIWWQAAGASLPEGRFDLAYTVRASDYRGQREVQLEWVAARAAKVSAAVRPRIVSAPEVVDYREAADGRALLEGLRARRGLQVWCESSARRELGGQDRTELAPGSELAIWTTPPGPDELRAVLKTVAPHTVYLFAVDPAPADPTAVLSRVVGLVKASLRTDDGCVSLPRLAAATGQREATVRAALSWLEARRHILVLSREEDAWTLTEGQGQETGAARQQEALLVSLLAETAAFRSHFRRAAADSLLSAE